MIFLKTFKGYEDKVQDLDKVVNDWIIGHTVNVRSVQTALSHEVEGRHTSGDLIYTIMYDAPAPLP
jgi:hypothetical protein